MLAPLDIELLEIRSTFLLVTANADLVFGHQVLKFLVQVLPVRYHVVFSLHIVRQVHIVAIRRFNLNGHN